MSGIKDIFSPKIPKAAPIEKPKVVRKPTASDTKMGALEQRRVAQRRGGRASTVLSEATSSSQKLG